jgi:HK97 family phage major capsid protein
MDINELKALIEKATANFEAQKKENAELTVQIKAQEEKFTQLKGEFDKLKEGGDQDEAKKMAKDLEELTNEISDLRSKYKAPAAVVTEDQKKAMHDAILKPVIGEWLKGKSNNTAPEFFKFIEQQGTERFKTLNLTNADQGGRAVAEVLSRDVIEYAREYSPVLGQVGRKPSMTRNFRELVLVTYPSVAEGIENVAGTDFAQTTTQEYKEVKSKEFKVSAKPRITDEAMYGADIDLYGDLVRLLGREISIYLAAQVLYGNGTGKNARGILSSKRVDITDGTGKSWLPTLAANPANARPADYYPAVSTGVAGDLGADDVARVNFIIDLVNKLPTQWLPGAKFHMNRKVKGMLEKIRDENNKPVFMNSYREGDGFMLMGFPVVIDDTLPNMTANSTPIIFGNLGAAYAINDGDIDKLLIDPYSVDDCTVVKYSKEMFEMVQNSDAILVVACTTNDATP